MTIDEALEMVRQTEECWIVFNSEKGEVLSVEENHPDETHQDMFAHLATLSRFNQPVMTRFFTSAEVTRKVLESQQSESERVRTRTRVLTEWSQAPTEKLLGILERLVSVEDAWTMCGACCYGRVSEAERFGAQACPACLGLGFRPVPDAKSCV